MKKRLLMMIFLVFAICLFSVNIFASEDFSNTTYETNQGIIQYYDDFIEGYEARCELMRENTFALGGDPEKELIVDNCVIIDTWKPIEIDPSHVLAGVRYSIFYYIRYDSVEAAEAAVAVFQTNPNVKAVGRDGSYPGFYEEDKIKYYDDFIEGYVAYGELQLDNTIARGGDPKKELIVDNCVIVMTREPIEIDPSHVLAGVRYYRTYSIRYDSVEAAEAAVAVFQTYPTVTAVGCDGFDSEYWELYENEKIKYYDDFIEGYEAQCELMLDNTIARGGDPEKELIVDNCVVVRSKEDIKLDTTHVIAAVRYGKFYYIRYDSSQEAINAVSLLEKEASVSSVGRDAYVEYDLFDQEIEPMASGFANNTTHSWGTSTIEADSFAAYVGSRTQGSVTVAVIDTGVDATHPFLSDWVLNNGYDFSNQSSNQFDASGHGTHVAGIIVDATPGLAVYILPVRVLGGTYGYCPSTIAAGIDYSVDEGADVLNMSFGGSVELEGHTIIHDAVEDAIDNGVIIVAASGNGYESTSGICPAHFNNIIVTAAIDEEFNNYYIPTGPESLLQGSNYGTSVDITAPGVNIESSVPYMFYGSYYTALTGTSMAAPHVSAAAAMLRLLYPSASPAVIENLLKNSALDLGPVGYDTTFGYGVPQLSNLMSYLTFYDVQPYHWYYEVVRDINATGYMTGMNSEYFGAVENMQRQDIAVVFYRMAGSPTVTYHPVFPDVSSNQYFANAAVWAYDNGIIVGQNGLLGVGNNITRQDFVTILFRYAAYLGLDTTARASLNRYTDAVQVSPWALESMQWAVANGLIGLDVTSLNPVDNAARAEIAAMMMRFIDFANEQ